MELLEIHWFKNNPKLALPASRPLSQPNYHIDLLHKIGGAFVEYKFQVKRAFT